MKTYYLYADVDNVAVCNHHGVLLFTKAAASFWQTVLGLRSDSTWTPFSLSELRPCLRKYLQGLSKQVKSTRTPLRLYSDSEKILPESE
jgi:hypothetical protein